MTTTTQMATQAQIHVLDRILGPTERERIRTLTKWEAWRLIKQHQQDWPTMAPTEKQKLFLKARGKWNDNLTRGTACTLIGQIIEAERKMSPPEMASYRASWPNQPAPESETLQNAGSGI